MCAQDHDNNDKMGIRDMSKGYILFATLHFFQLVLAVTVCGLYGVELNRAAKAGVYGDGKWVCTSDFSSQTRKKELMLWMSNRSTPKS